MALLPALSFGLANGWLPAAIFYLVSGILLLLFPKPVVAGLDQRFGWSPASGRPVKPLAPVVIVAGYALSSYALIENRFLSSQVRIQAERGHRVVSSGPYRRVRHPGYAGGVVN